VEDESPAPPKDTAELKVKIYNQLWDTFWKQIAQPIVNLGAPKLVGVVAALLTTTATVGQVTGAVPVVDYAQNVVSVVSGKPTQQVELNLPFVKNSQTRDVLIQGQRFTSLEFSDLEIGPPPSCNAITIGTTSGEIICQELIIDGVQAPSISISTSTAYNLIVNNNRADGNSHNDTVGTTTDIIFTTTRGSVSSTTTNSSYDKLNINGGTGSTVGTFILRNVRVRGGAIVIANLKCGTITITNSVFGSGDGIASADFIINSSVITSFPNFTSNTEDTVSIH
jgi:hypothetical protein